MYNPTMQKTLNIKKNLAMYAAINYKHGAAADAMSI